MKRKMKETNKLILLILTLLCFLFSSCFILTTREYKSKALDSFEEECFWDETVPLSSFERYKVENFYCFITTRPDYHRKENDLLFLFCIVDSDFSKPDFKITDITIKDKKGKKIYYCKEFNLLNPDCIPTINPCERKGFLEYGTLLSDSKDYTHLSYKKMKDSFYAVSFYVNGKLHSDILQKEIYQELVCIF